MEEVEVPAEAAEVLLPEVKIVDLMERVVQAETGAAVPEPWESYIKQRQLP